MLAASSAASDQLPSTFTNEWRTAVTECCLGCANSGRSSTQIGTLNLSHRRGNASQRLNHVVNAAIVESLELTGLGVIPQAMGNLGVGHCPQSEKRSERHSYFYKL